MLVIPPAASPGPQLVCPALGGQGKGTGGAGSPGSAPASQDRPLLVTGGWGGMRAGGVLHVTAACQPNPTPSALAVV